MNALKTILAGVLLVPVFASAAYAQSVEQHAKHAVGKAEAALVATGVPLWVWAVIAVVVLIALFALARRRRPTQAVIKTRLG